MWLKPAEGRIGLRDPRSFVRMPEGGREINLNGPDGKFWRLALRDGGAVEGAPPGSAGQGKAETPVPPDAAADSAAPVSRVSAPEAAPTQEPERPAAAMAAGVQGTPVDVTREPAAATPAAPPATVEGAVA